RARLEPPAADSSSLVRWLRSSSIFSENPGICDSLPYPVRWQYRTHNAPGFAIGRRRPAGTLRRQASSYELGDMMEQPMDFLALSLLAAVSVTVGLTSAAYGPGVSSPGARGNLAATVAAVLGLDPGQVNDYLQGLPSEIGFGA